jgi:hypothetical protein
MSGPGLTGQIFNFLAGALYSTTPPTAVAGEFNSLQCDASAQLRVVTRTDTPSVYAYTTHPANDLQVKTTAGSLLEVSASNSSGSTLYLQIFDSATLPTDGSYPTMGRYVLPPGATGDFAYSCPRPFANGCWVVVSTTFDGKTIDTSSSVDIQATVL